MTKIITVPISDFKIFKIQMLNWVNQFNIFCLLDNNSYTLFNPAFECLLAAGSKKNITASAGNAFEQLKKFSLQNNANWLFGHFGYDLKNELEVLQSAHDDHIGFADLHFFIPETVINLSLHTAVIHSDEPDKVLSQIVSQPTTIATEIVNPGIVQHKITHRQYIEAILKLKEHLRRGDCYEINFCQEFFTENTAVNPLSLYHQFANISPNPFAAFYKVGDKYCIGASPERYLQKQGDKLISQPIKGTAKRNLQNPAADEAAKEYLMTSAKERSENITVVDLVRNDLSKICKPGTVQVEELCGVYSFPQVHQMISTITGTMVNDLHWTDAIRATFPMGSMTGAPKKKVMQLIEKYEYTKRGLFSGAIGYITPGQDFDFNVVIRSAFYNATNQYLSYSAGGGITYFSDPQKEYEESLLKAAAFTKILQN